MDLNGATAKTKTKMKPSNYNAKTFHGVRIISAISSIIVTGILVWFCIELKNEQFKIPWTFLIVLAASCLTLITLILTTAIHLCTRLSPIFNLIINIPLLIVWIVGMALLGWNIYGTLAHTCNTANWGNNDGVMICQQYKALFSFVVFGTISQIGMIIVDVRARISQTRSGRYAKMRDSTSEVKLEPYDSTHANTSLSSHDVSTTAYQDEPGWRPGQRSDVMAMGRQNTTATSSSRYTDYTTTTQSQHNQYHNHESEDQHRLEEVDITGRDGRANEYYQAYPGGGNPYGHGVQTGYDSTYGRQGYGHRY